MAQLCYYRHLYNSDTSCVFCAGFQKISPEDHRQDDVDSARSSSAPRRVTASRSSHAGVVAFQLTSDLLNSRPFQPDGQMEKLRQDRGEDLNLSFLLEHERDAILRVLQKDEKLRKREEKRIRWAETHIGIY